MILNRFRIKNSSQHGAGTVNEMVQSELSKNNDSNEEWHELYLSDSLSNSDISSNAMLRNVVWNDQIPENRNQRGSSRQDSQSNTAANNTAQSNTTQQEVIKTAIGEGTIIEGKFKFDSPVRIDGELTGEVVSSSVLIVGETAVIKAQIRVGSLIVYGKVIGDVVAEELISVKTDGILEGNLRTRRISIEDGGYFKGLVNA